MFVFTGVVERERQKKKKNSRKDRHEPRPATVEYCASFPQSSPCAKSPRARPDHDDQIAFFNVNIIIIFL